MILSENSHHRLAFPAAALPAPNVCKRAVEFVGGHAKPKAGEAEPNDKCEDKRGSKAECPHHAAAHERRKFGIACGTERCGDDEVYGFEGLHGDVAPEADFAEAENFGVVGVEPEQVFAEECDCDG